MMVTRALQTPLIGPRADREEAHLEMTKLRSEGEREAASQGQGEYSRQKNRIKALRAWSLGPGELEKDVGGCWGGWWAGSGTQMVSLVPSSNLGEA